MRKISKSRADDDVISLTNGSMLSEAQPIASEAAINTSKKETEFVDNDNTEQSVENTSDNSKEIDNFNKNKNGKAKRKKIIKQESYVEEEEYEVDKIIDSKKIKGKLHYLIRWKGYSADSDTWEPEKTLSCPDLMNKFNNEKVDTKNRDVSLGKTNKKRKSLKDIKPNSKRAKSEWNSKSTDENAEYEVDRILEVHQKKNGNREFLIHWKGWSSKFNSWEPESNLNCSELIKKFMDKVSVARSTESRNLRVAPETTNRFTLQSPSQGRRLSRRRGQHQRVRYDDAE